MKRCKSDARQTASAALVNVHSTQLDVVDLTDFVCGSTSHAARRRAASAVLNSLRHTGCLIVRDPRVPHESNNRFLDMMEQYFARPTEQKMRDCRPESHYQVGPEQLLRSS
jgi:isopenicillin N synthase-like dioxygenase